MSDRFLSALRNDLVSASAQLASFDSRVVEDMTTALALMATERDGAELKYQVILWSAEGGDFATLRYYEYADGYFWLQ
jgi:hypothetical protein